MPNDSLAFTKLLLHDLRSELGVIILNASLESMLNDPDRAVRLRNANGMIIEHARYMMDLINKADRIYTLQYDTIDVEPTRVDLVDYTNQIIREMNDPARGEIWFESSISKLNLAIDTIRYREALVYLLEDLLQDSALPHPIHVRLSYGKKKVISLVLINPALNLSSEKLASVFTPFNRIQKSASTTDRGTGLGLFLAKKIFQDILGGEIKVNSNPAYGIKYTIKLPLEVSNKGQSVLKN